MGLLNFKGDLLTYQHYKDKIELYKKHGLLQVKSLVKAH
jgi:hypothetical protein